MDADHPGFSVQTGEVRSRGVEVEGKASLADGLNITAAFTHMNIVVTAANDNTLGKVPTFQPNYIASFWGDYTVQSGPLTGFGFGAGVRYFGSTYGDSINSFTVPPYTLVDATARYDLVNLNSLLKGYQFSVNATNLFDQTYVTGCASLNGCYYGARRTVLATLRYRW